jgi:hypothetical protein
MTTHTIEELNSDKVLVCSQEKVNDHGVAVIWYALMADGHLLDCGVGQPGLDRANVVAAALNAIR